MTKAMIWLLSVLATGGLQLPTILYVDDDAVLDPGPGTPAVSDPLENGSMAHPYDAIQEAIDAAGPYDQIVVLEGTYRGTGNRDIQVGSKPLTIGPEPSMPYARIDGEWAGRGFHIVGAPSGTTIRGFMIKNCVNEDAPEAGGGGGAMYIEDSQLTVEMCSFSNNQSRVGAGVLIRNSTAVFRYCDSSANECSYFGPDEGVTLGGAGLCALDCEDLVLDDFVFTFNEAPGHHNKGGGIRAEGGSMTIRNGLFVMNETDGFGGAIHADGCQLDIVNCTLDNNVSSDDGGALFIGSGAAVTAKNTIFWSNECGGRGKGIFVDADDLSAASFVYSYCDVGSGAIEGPGDIADMIGNIMADPHFAQAGYYDNGMLFGGDYHLKSMVGRRDWEVNGWVKDEVHSPCIDAGDPADDIGEEQFPNGGRINMGFYGGSYWASMSSHCDPPLSADINGDCVVDFADLAKLAGQWLQCSKVPQELCGR